MAIFSISDIIIAITLIINATALVSSKVVSNELVVDAFTARVRTLVYGIRKYSFILVVWNGFFFILIAFVFRSKKDDT